MYASVYVRLGREVEDGVRALFERGEHGRGVADVSAHEAVARVVEPFEVVEVPGVSERVEVSDAAPGEFFQQQPDEGGAYEARAPCYEKNLHSSEVV